MSVLNLFISARHALSQHRKRAKAYSELMALDDRSLADIGLHRSEIPGILANSKPADRAPSCATATRPAKATRTKVA